MSSEKEPLFSSKNVLVFSNLIVSLLRNTIPSRIRIIVQLTIVASLVILVDQILKAFAYEVSKQLSVFVGLIITNCIIMGRLEAFALGNKPWPAVLDGFGNAAGYGLILVIVGFVRELFGTGNLTFPGIGEVQIVPDIVYEWGYVDNGLMILPPMALITVGIIIWVQRSKNKDLVDIS
jgi:Na+-transporting NADH:ubiquinone oxidoreductase subunit D